MFQILERDVLTVMVECFFENLVRNLMQLIADVP